MADFVAVGDVMLDVTLDRDPPPTGTRAHAPLRVRPGGSAATAGAWAAATGASAAVIGRVGDDAAGRLVAWGIEDRGARAMLAIDSDRPTGTALALGSGDPRTIVADRGANAGLTPDDVPASIDAAAVLVSGYALFHSDSEPAARGALERASGQWIAVDLGSEALVRQRGAERVYDLTAGATVLLATEEEARALTGLEADSSARALSERYRVVCVKRGRAGAVLATDGKVEASAPAAVEAVAAFGPGDAFAAALLVALARGSPVSSALAEACRTGALAARVGGWPPGDR